MMESAEVEFRSDSNPLPGGANTKAFSEGVLLLMGVRQS